MDAISLIDRRDRVGTNAATTRSRSRGGSIGRIVSITSASLVVAIVIVGFVVAGLGLGLDGHAGIGPDRPPPPATTPH
jgi:hypothetical protein